MTQPRPVILAIFSLLVVLVVTGRARAEDYISSSGHSYILSCNKDGYVLTSRYPVSRWIGEGYQTRAITDREAIYLGKSCDAFHEVLGKGTWGWANGGFAATFENDTRIGFPRQELQCDGKIPDFQADCRF